MPAQRDGLTLRQQQRLTLTPEMRTTLSVLRMSGTALQEHLEAQAAENPILTLRRPRSEASGAAPGGPSAYDLALDTTGAERSLGERLRAQLSLMALEPQIQDIAFVLTWSLSDTGYLDVDLADLSQEVQLPADRIETALAALQACEPAGVGARSLAECLSLQLIELGFEADLAQAATRVLDRLAAGEIAKAARATGLDTTALAEIAEALPKLTPYPGQAALPAPRVSLPDVELRFPDGASPEITVLRGNARTLELDEELLSVARLESDTALASYGTEAEALRRALSYRTTTLTRIVAFLGDYQIGFFREGGAAMKPLTRTQLAQELKLHPTTVGRAVADKTLAHPGGVVPLSAFFSATLGADSQDAVSAYGAQARIAALVAGETEDAILTDTEIAHKLKNEGVDIARRTVAKYRGCLNIPSSYDRKRLRAAARMRGRV
ncbi:RNA polymerase factor sigma-54 [Dinoroseobacter sp. S124A]|uniref:RNA polymerase factor sigma-54 n=1 Tax=Dinoroseobacter sp. S124A TaxID=3415128 RepID=UPI003C7D2AF6